MAESIDYGTSFQEFLLNILATNPEVYVRCQNILEPKYFDMKFSKAVKFIKEYSAEHNTLPTTTEIKVKSGVEPKKIEDFCEVHHNAALQEIEDFCRHKALEFAVIESMEHVKTKKYGDIENLVKQAMMVSLQKDIGTDYFANPEERNKRLFSSQATIKTGWKDIDFKLFGGFGTGELEVFAAPSGGGKSLALQNIALNLSKQGIEGVYISLELKEELVAQRMDSMLIGKSKKEIVSNISDASLAVQMQSKGMGKIFIKRLPENATTVNDVRAYLKELQIKTGVKPKYLCVDYLDLLGTPRADSSDVFNKDKYVSEDLRALAHELDLCCISASQLGRSAIEAEEYTHANIAGGISKIYTADNVIGIRNTPSMRERGEIMFEFLKTRNSDGNGAKVKLNLNIDTMKISDYEGSQDANSIQVDNNSLNKVNKVQNSPLDKLSQLSSLRNSVNNR